MTLPFLSCPALGGCGDPGWPIRYALLLTGTEYLHRTLGAAGDLKQIDISFWARRHVLGAAQVILGVANGANYDRIGFNAGDQFVAQNGAQGTVYGTTGLQRDPAGWSHWHVAINSNAGTVGDRLKVTHDGVVQSMSGTGPTLDLAYQILGTAMLAIGRLGSSATEFARLLLAELHIIDGGGTAATDFGYWNADGHWVPRRYTGGHPDQSSYHPFDEPLNLGRDASGNGLHFTTVGLTAANQVMDTPTTPRRTLNALRFWGAYNGSMGLSRGGWQHSSTNSVAEKGAVSAQPHSSGKWYYEVKVDGTFAGNFSGVGTIHPNNDTKPGERADTVLWLDTGTLRKGGTGNAYGTALASSSDVLMVALDADLGHIWFGRNGVWFGGGNPATGANPAATGLVRPMLLATYVYSNLVNQLWVNAGQATYAHTPPAGFDAPYEEPWDCPEILNPDDWFTVRRRSGGASVTDLPWDPTQHKTLVVSKREDTSSSWQVVDTVGGAGFAWETDDASAGLTADPTGLTAFTPTGYDVGASTPWQGTRTDEIYRAGRRSGFDILTINHVNGVASTVPHAAGGPIDYAWVVRMDAGADRRVFHRGMSAGQYLRLNSVSGPSTDAAWFASTANDVTLGASMPTGTYRLYVWRAVPQFSAFPTYTGLGVADGPMLLTDFAPRKLDTHRLDGAGNWYCLLPPVVGGNPAGVLRYYEVPSVPAIGAYADLNSNGAKIRNADGSWNTSTANNMAALWAAAPAKFARAQ